FHFILTLEIIFLIGQSITITATTTNWRCLFFPILNAKQDVVRIGIFLFYIICVIARYELNLMALCHFHQTLIYSLFILLIVAHDFYIKIFTKLFFPPQQCFFSLIFSYVQYLRRNFSINTTRQDDYIFLIFFDYIPIYARHVIKPGSIGN